MVPSFLSLKPISLAWSFLTQMAKKKKGRQAGVFASKSQRATFQHECQERIHEVQQQQAARQRASQQRGSSSSSAERPKLQLSMFHGLIRERQSYDSYLHRERRRRNGFLPNVVEESSTTPAASVIRHPPGWLLNYNEEEQQQLQQSDSSMHSGTNPPHPSSSTTLQELALDVFIRYFDAYLDQLGPHTLHSVITSSFSADLLQRLSIGVPIRNNDMAYCLGAHSHIQGLCLRPTPLTTTTFTNSGLEALIPRLPNSNKTSHLSRVAREDQVCSNNISPVSTQGEEEEEETWESLVVLDDDKRENHHLGLTAPFPPQQWDDLDLLQWQGCNIRLKRLELLDCHDLSASTVVAFLDRCCWITHLSLAGCTFHHDHPQANGEQHTNVPAPTTDIRGGGGGTQIIQALPRLLPRLQVLDVTRCYWWNRKDVGSILQEAYRQQTRRPSRQLQQSSSNTSTATSTPVAAASTTTTLRIYSQQGCWEVPY